MKLKMAAVLSIVLTVLPIIGVSETLEVDKSTVPWSYRVIGQPTKISPLAIAEGFSSTNSYGIGSVVMFNGNRYVCTNEVQSGHGFSYSDWEAKTVQEAIEEGGGGSFNPTNVLLVFSSDSLRYHNVNGEIVEYGEPYDHLGGYWISFQTNQAVVVTNIYHSEGWESSGVYAWSNGTNSRIKYMKRYNQFVTYGAVRYADAIMLESPGDLDPESDSYATDQTVNTFRFNNEYFHYVPQHRLPLGWHVMDRFATTTEVRNAINRVPNPPQTGTYVLKSVSGKIQWVSQ